jgi:hypothetical protein
MKFTSSFLAIALAIACVTATPMVGDVRIIVCLWLCLLTFDHRFLGCTKYYFYVLATAQFWRRSRSSFCIPRGMPR